MCFPVLKARQYFVVSSCMFLDEKTVLGEIWLNAGLNLTIFLGTGGPGVQFLHFTSERNESKLT